MTPLENITAAIAEDMLSNPWKNFIKQNPALGPKVRTYLNGGARPTDSELGNNHYAKARVGSEDARRALAQTAVAPAVPEQLGDYDVVISVPGSLTKISGTTFRADAYITL